jgi:hypothetical protein
LLFLLEKVLSQGLKRALPFSIIRVFNIIEAMSTIASSLSSPIQKPVIDWRLAFVLFSVCVVPKNIINFKFMMLQEDYLALELIFGNLRRTSRTASPVLGL